MNMKRFGRGGLLAASLAFLLALLVLFSHDQVDSQTLLTYFREIKWSGVFFVFLFHSLAQICLFVAWRRILVFLGNQSAWQHDFFAYNLSILARRIPLPIWYLGARIYFHKSEENARIPLVLTASAIELLFILFGGIICFVALAPWYQFEWFQKINLYVVMIMALPVVLLVISIIRPGVGARFINWGMHRFYKNRSRIFLHRQDYIVLVLLYTSVWFLDGLGFYAMVWSLTPSGATHLAASIVGVSTITALVGIATMIFPFGFAAKEISATLLLLNWFPALISFAIVIVYRILHIFIELVWVLAGVVMNKFFAPFPESQTYEPLVMPDPRTEKMRISF